MWGLTLTKRWQDIGKTLARHWQNVGKALAFRCKAMGCFFFSVPLQRRNKKERTK